MLLLGSGMFVRQKGAEPRSPKWCGWKPGRAGCWGPWPGLGSEAACGGGPGCAQGPAGALTAAAFLCWSLHTVSDSRVSSSSVTSLQCRLLPTFRFGPGPLVRLPSAVVCPPRVFPVNGVDQCVIFHSWFLSWAQPDFLFFFFPQVPWSLRTCPPSCRG